MFVQNVDYILFTIPNSDLPSIHTGPFSPLLLLPWGPLGDCGGGREGIQSRLYYGRLGQGHQEGSGFFPRLSFSVLTKTALLGAHVWESWLLIGASFMVQGLS